MAMPQTKDLFKHIVQIEGLDHEQVGQVAKEFMDAGWLVTIEPTLPECCRNCPGRFGQVCHCTLPHYTRGMTC
jgi:hypothetical protein